MSDTLAQGFWAWSLDRYARPGVEEALIALQDRRGLDVCLLLWCAWCGERFDAVDPQAMAQAVALARPWSRDVTGPLRAVRRALKTPSSEAARAGAPILRETVKKLELDAERIAHAALADLAHAFAPRAEPPGLSDAQARARRNFGTYLAAEGRDGEEADAETRALLDALAARLFACSGAREGSNL
ncbi:MAG: hypothetical protein Kow00133_13320 [Amphiplicatus sp.]